MSLNCEEIDIVLSELNLTGSFIQQIVQPSYDSLALYTYKEGRAKTVFISLANGACRINETRKKIPKNEKPLRFMEFLKSRIKGCRIDFCEQIGKERIIKMELSRRMEEEGGLDRQRCGADENCADEIPIQKFFMFIRLWSGSANIILTDENLKILDCFYRRPNKNEVGGKFFELPECCTLPDFPTSTECREQTGERTNSKKFVARTFDDICSGVHGGNCSDDENNTSGDNCSPLSYNEKIELYYSEHAQTFSREALLIQAEKYYSEHKTKIEGAISRLQRKRDDFLKNDELKHFGDLLLSSPLDSAFIEGTFIECEDYDLPKKDDGSFEKVKIKIDPKKTIQENARDYYENYKKSLSGLEELEHDISRLKKELLDLESQYEAILSEPNPIRLQQLLKKQTRPKQQIKKNRPGLTYIMNDWTIFVGRDADENDELLRHHVKGQDMWMHTRDFAGGYVFIKNRPGKTIPLEILLNAGNLAVHHSKARKVGQADLYYTQVKYLRRAKDGPKGLVLPTHEKNITIKIDSERLFKMEDYKIEN